jgi:hypothetical protein
MDLRRFMIATSEVSLDGPETIGVGYVAQGKCGAVLNTCGETGPEWMRGQERSKEVQGAKFGPKGQGAVGLGGKRRP